MADKNLNEALDDFATALADALLFDSIFDWLDMAILRVEDFFTALGIKLGIFRLFERLSSFARGIGLV